LSAAKQEFHKYGEVWDKLAKQLNTAQKTVEDAGRRTRAVERTLRNVESSAGIETSAEVAAIAAMSDEIAFEDDVEAADEDRTSES
jgi:DNA recombination protein RmuC